MNLRPRNNLVAIAHPGVVGRRLRGLVADELFLHASATVPTGNAGRDAASAYEALAAVLAEQGAAPENLVQEQVFLRPLRDDLVAATAARRRILGHAGPGESQGAPAATWIGQAPLRDPRSCIEVLATALVPHADQGPSWLPDAACPASCRCADCKPGHRGRMVRIGNHLHLHAAGILGQGEGAEAQAFDAFVQAERLLERAGMDFRNVVRTWIHLRDIDRDYAALNDARRAFFASRSVEQRPASTGVQGIPFAAGHDVSLSLLAIKGDGPVDARRMSTPTLNEAWSYGADFSRGLRVVDGNKTALFLSGTASIDEQGTSVHAGDLGAQADRMVRNIETLLAGQEAGQGDLVSAIAYVKHPADGAALLRRMEASGFGGLPLAVVEAPLCRPELLCETEALAVLPSPPGR